MQINRGLLLGVRHFLSVSRVDVEFSACLSTLWSVARAAATRADVWRPWPTHMAGLYNKDPARALAATFSTQFQLIFFSLSLLKKMASFEKPEKSDRSFPIQLRAHLPGSCAHRETLNRRRRPQLLHLPRRRTQGRSAAFLYPAQAPPPNVSLSGGAQEEGTQVRLIFFISCIYILYFFLMKKTKPPFAQASST